jgi:hypothetical protein
MNLFTLVEQQAACQPDKTALIFGKCRREHTLPISSFLTTFTARPATFGQQASLDLKMVSRL